MLTVILLAAAICVLVRPVMETKKQEAEREEVALRAALLVAYQKAFGTPLGNAELYRLFRAQYRDREICDKRMPGPFSRTPLVQARRALKCLSALYKKHPSLDWDRSRRCECLLSLGFMEAAGCCAPPDTVAAEAYFRTALRLRRGDGTAAQALRCLKLSDMERGRM